MSLYEISLPFALGFSHAKSKENLSRNIIAEVATSYNDITGYGEGASRLYPPDKTSVDVIKSAAKLLKNDYFPWQIEDPSDIWEFVDRVPDSRISNAAICALEMALLDGLGKSEGKYLMEYLPNEFATKKIRYGVTIPIAESEIITKISSLARVMEINKLRIKMGREVSKNFEAIDAVRKIFHGECEIRIDPNGSWDKRLAFDHLDLIREGQIKIVEEPMSDDKEGLKAFSEKLASLGVILMACQSANTFRDAERISAEGIYGMVNVKLSRSGGFRRSFKIIDLLRREGISYQIGCNRGESGILSAAGRIIGLLSRDALYYDGSYDSFLLKENTTTEDVSFGKRGLAGPLIGHGLGVDIDTARLVRLCDQSTKITVKRGSLT